MELLLLLIYRVQSEVKFQEGGGIFQKNHSHKNSQIQSNKITKFKRRSASFVGLGLLHASKGVMPTLFYPLLSLCYFLTNCAKFLFLLVPPDKIIIPSPRL